MELFQIGMVFLIRRLLKNSFKYSNLFIPCNNNNNLFQKHATCPPRWVNLCSQLNPRLKFLQFSIRIWITRCNAMQWFVQCQAPYIADCNTVSNYGFSDEENIIVVVVVVTVVAYITYGHFQKLFLFRLTIFGHIGRETRISWGSNRVIFLSANTTLCPHTFEFRSSLTGFDLLVQTLAEQDFTEFFSKCRVHSSIYEWIDSVG